MLCTYELDLFVSSSDMNMHRRYSALTEQIEQACMFIAPCACYSSFKKIMYMFLLPTAMPAFTYLGRVMGEGCVLGSHLR